MKSNFTIVRKTLFLFCTLLLTSLGLKAQMQVTNTANISSAYDPISLISNVFISGGVDIDTIIFTGTAAQVGFFQNGTTAIGIDQGIIITNGNAEDADNGNTSGATTTQYNTTNTTSPLNNIATGSVNDIAQYEIIFTPTSTNLSFDYVFASEEYPEWVGSTFNDVFGFFISQPGGGAPFTNIALIPGTTTPVSINNVNAGANSSYYNSNTGGTALEYDGYTTVLTASATVVPCQQYRIIIAVSDVGDWSYDSAVFLKGSSFSTNALAATPITPSPDTVLVEGCASGQMKFSLNSPATTPVAVTYTLAGTAIMGVDYDPIPLSGVIPTGGTSFTININPIADGLVEGTEYIDFILNTTPCTTDTIRIYIQDNNFAIGDIDTTFICLGDSVLLDATSPMPIPPPYNYTQTFSAPNNVIVDFSANTFDMNISGFPFPQVTAGMIESVCININHPWDADLDIFLIAPDGKFLELSTDNGGSGDNYINTCFSPTATNKINLPPAAPPFTGTFAPEGNWNFLYGAPVNGTWTLQVTDDAFGFSGTISNFSINFAPIYDIQYSWTPNSNITCTNCPAVTVFPTTPTTYIVSATDTYGCTTADTSLVDVGTQLPAPSISCGPASTGIVEFVWQPIPTASGYVVNVNNTGWVSSNGTTSHQVTGLSPGQSVTIQVQATGGNCTGTPQIGTFTCTALNCSLTSSLDSTVNISCPGLSDGVIYTSAPTGVAPFTFTLNGVTQATGTFTGLPAGVYTVVVGDATGCVENVPVTLTQPTTIQTNFTISNVSCNGGNDGSVVATPSGGTAPYTFIWSNAQVGNTLTNVVAGSYTLTVTDASGCTQVSTATVSEPSVLISSLAVTNVLCNGGNSGQIIALPTGGTVPYTYAWAHNLSLNSDTASNLVAGFYAVTITDANGCQVVNSGTVGEPPALGITLTGVDVSCNSAADGTATATVTDGTTPYAYLWSNGQTTATATGLGGGTHIITVTDANNCQIVDSLTINELPAITLTNTFANLSCNNSNDGFISISATGGTGSFTYAWSHNAAVLISTLPNLPAGTFIITVTDTDNCSAQDTVTLTQPPVLTVAMASSNINCHNAANGTASGTPSGGTAPYTYAWTYNGANLGITDSFLTNIDTGFYQVTVTDANGCTTTGSVQITQPTPVVASVTTTDATCNGSADGTATATASGGTGTLTYTWNTNPIQTTATATGLNPGIYTVTVTDANNCTTTAFDTVVVPDPIILSGSATSITCFGASDGTASVTITGGTLPYSYLWNTTPPQTDSIATGLTVGTYTVTVTDNNGCFESFPITVTGAVIVDLDLDSIPVNCFGGNDGQASVVATGGTPPYTYSWNTTPTQNTTTATGLTAGFYTVLVTGTNGCAGMDSIEVTQPTPLLGNTTFTPLNCFEDGQGTATVIVTGGAGGYTYNWSTTPVQTSATATGLMAGTYTVTSTDANNCTISNTVTVTQPDSITLTLTSTQVSCNGANDGTATVTASGGTAPYTYIWSNAGTTATVTGLSGGTYTVTVTDANNCTKSASIFVLEQPVINLAITGTDVSCFGGNDGTATVTASGGTSNFTYAWSSVPSQTTATATALTAGTYTVTVTDSDGCSQMISTTLNQPDSIGLTLVKTDITCNGANDGVASVTVTGGTAPYTFAWNTTPVQNSQTIAGLDAGIYTVTVTDALGCTNQQSITVVEPSGITYSTASTGLLCNGDFSGTATVIASGGTAPLSYTWNTAPIQNSSTATGLAAGTYTFTVTDASSCFVVDSVVVTQPDKLNSSTQTSAVICSGGSSGAATAIPIGGTPPYGFTWSTNPPSFTSSLTGIPSGQYYITITDANGCITEDTAVVTEPTLLAITLTSTNVTCAGGSNGAADVAVFGGTPPYNYNWIPTGSTNDSISNLGAGWYTVVVTDSVNCQISDSILVQEPSPITLNMSATSVVCSGDTNGTVTAIPSGGSGGYSYAWNTIPTQTTATITGLSPGWYVVTVTDLNNCTGIDSIEVVAPNALTLSLTGTNIDCFGSATGSVQSLTSGGVMPYTFAWSNGASSPNLQNIIAGTYTLTVTDANGCNLVESFTITQPQTALQVSVSGTEVSCFGGNNGTATATVVGGTQPYAYLWTGINQTTATASGLTAGTYTVVVTDANNCFIIDTVVIEEPAPITLVLTQQGASCFGNSDGTATVAASGGVPNYTFVWSTIPQQTGSTATNLTGGQTYTVTAIDARGCTEVQSITIGQPSQIILSTGQNNVSCHGLTDGDATVSATGGTPGYTFLWGTAANSQTTATATNLAAGAYTVTATDVFGCTAVTSVVITQPNPLAINIATENVACKGAATGSATSTFAGGTPPYYVTWQGGIQSSVIENLAAGTYALTVTDANNCQLSDSTTITEPAFELTATVNSLDATCFGDRDGVVEIAAAGGTPPFKYSLDGNNFTNASRLVGLTAGDYTVYTRDANGCIISENTTINQPDEFTVDARADFTIELGSPANLGVITTNGVAPFSYTWTPANNLSCNNCPNPIADSLFFDTYFEVFVLDADGCEAEDDVFVRVNSPRYVFIANAFTPNDDGNNDVLFVQGGNGTVRVVSFQVFDRWGELVFTAEDTPLNDPTFGWDGTFDGTQMNTGVFAWVVEVEFIDGERIVYKGSTSIIR